MSSDDEVRSKSKKDKKEKKEKKSSDGVQKVKKDKKDKKEKKAEKEKLKQKVAETFDKQLQADAAASSKTDDDDHPGSDFEDIKNPEVKTKLVYFAVPLADDKGHKKIYKAIKKGLSTRNAPRAPFAIHLGLLGRVQNLSHA